MVSTGEQVFLRSHHENLTLIFVTCVVIPGIQPLVYSPRLFAKKRLGLQEQSLDSQLGAS